MAESNSLARPYAKAVFAIALATNNLKEWSELLQFLAEVSADSQVGEFLLDPRLNYKQRSELFIDVCGNRVGKLGSNLLRVLATNRRLINLPQIYQLYEELRTQHEQTIKIEVISTQELTAKQQQRLQLVLAHRFKSAVELSYEQDQNLLGGIMIRAGDRVIDGSLRNLLAGLKRQLLR